jgi:beta-glucosidase
MAPGKAEPRAAGAVVHHLHLAHGQAVVAFHASESTGRIGPCVQLAPCYPADDSREAEAAAQQADITENALYLDPILKGRYPTLGEAAGEFAAGLEAAVQPGDLAVVAAAPVDFLGVNYYSPVVVDGVGRSAQTHPVSAAGWQQVYPEGIYDALIGLKRNYGSPEVTITENGLPDDPTDADDPSADRTRVAFLTQHLAAVHRSLAAGCRVTGFHAWILFHGRSGLTAIAAQLDWCR